MSSKMLIDASHAEETRVVITKGNRIEDFDFESEHKKQIRGNIYLAKVTRVEPSLQAAFVEYGGNRHGFLAFSEIHPDYYQIPVADREALLREYQRELEADEDEDAVEAPSDDGEEHSPKTKRRSRRGGRSRKARGADADESPDTGGSDEDPSDAEDTAADADPSGDEPPLMEMAVEDDSVSEEPSGNGEDAPAPKRRATRRRKAPVAAPNEEADAAVAATPEPTGTSEGDDAPAEDEKPKRRSRRKKAEPEAAAPETSSDNVEPTDTAPGGTEEPAKPKRRSTRRKKADTTADAVSDEGEAPAPETIEALSLNEAEGAAEAEAQPEKPKRKRTSRRKKAMDAEPAEDAGENELVAREADGEDTTPPAEAVEDVEETGATDALEEAAPVRQRASRKHYKIQEVIKRRQILLVQVTKEERGNKGAALTTYLSLAGRYSVLMPNTARGGGISRKIAQASDRKRLREIAKSLDVPDGMGVILRTAAASRTEQEVNRDFDYLMRLWDSVRELTLSSSAPALVYEEGNLIKRSIRDLYSKSIGEIIVSGERGYREAKDFMKMLMPSQARVVKRWEKRAPLLAAHGVEAELDRMLQPSVTLRSGGYIIINQTEALVAIDVNSGRATREHSIEATALQTNLEAAEEVARQLRLRDLAGLIVIDFIDMDEKRNNRAVEKKLKDCLADDRARIQLGRISSFGLLEMSRQRMRSSVLEATMQVCDNCGGTGHVRSSSSVSLQIMRAIEEQLRKSPNHDVIAKADTATALYLLNNMRSYLTELEDQHGVNVRVEVDGTLTHQAFQVERGAFVENADENRRSIRQDATLMRDEDDEEDIPSEGDSVARLVDGEEGLSDEDGGRGRRRRGRRGGRGRRGEADANSGSGNVEEARSASETSSGDDVPDASSSEGEERPRRRSRRRNAEGEANAAASDDGRDPASTADEVATPDSAPDAKPRRSTSRRKAPIASDTAEPSDASEPGAAESEPSHEGTESSADATASVGDGRKPGRSTRRRKAPIAPPLDAGGQDEGDAEPAAETSGPTAEEESKPDGRRRTTRRKAPIAEADVAVAETVSEIVEEMDGKDAAVSSADKPDPESVEPDGETDSEGKPKRGWWQRGFF